MKKILIIGKRGFIGNNLFNYLKKKFKVKIISFKNLTKFKNQLNNFNFVINASINPNYITQKYKIKYDNDFLISKYINNHKTIYCFISTRKIYHSKPNLKENSMINPKNNYSKNKLITEKKLSKTFKKNLLILRVSNLIGEKKYFKNSHKTFIDIFIDNIKKGIIFENNKVYKDFLSIKKFCQIIKVIITKEIVGTYNVSIGQKVYLNQLVSWLNKYNKNKILKKNIINRTDSFYLNNKKLMSKIKIKNDLQDLKIYCYKLSRKIFNY